MMSPLHSKTFVIFTFLVTYNLIPLDASNEDGDTLNQVKPSKSTPTIQEPRIRLTEAAFGIPLPLDELFDQITSLPADDPAHDSNECTGGTDLSELDMCLTQGQLNQLETLRSRSAGRLKRQAQSSGFSLWKNAVIPYVFNSTFAAKDREAIISAMAEWEKATCIRFRPANMEDRDVVVFRDGKRCSTNIGRIGREQAVTLAKSCRSKRILIHELGHVIGLIHEHQRFDRDKYVKVLMENIRNMSQERYQFSKLLSGSITDKTVKYDYTSVMHYGKNYFARSPDLTTLQTTDRHFQDVIGRAEKPSFSDLETVNRLYQCSAGCPGSLRCGPSCYMDKSCVCRCRAGSDKAFFHGPGPYGNSLPDQTCEFFASRGECIGNIKDTIRPLCAKSCGLYQPKGGNRADVSSNWSPSSRLSAKPLGSPSFGSHINAPSLKEVSMYQGVDPVVSFSQTHTNRLRTSAIRPEQQFLPVGDTMTQNRIINSARNQLEPSSSVMSFRSSMLQRPASLGTSDSSIFGSLLMSRSSNGRTARLLIPTQVRGRGLQGRMSNRQRINYLARKAPRVSGYVSNNSELDTLLNNAQAGMNTRNGNAIKPRSRQSYQRGYSRQPLRSSTNYDLNGLGPSGISSLANVGGTNWRYTNRDRSMNYASRDAWQKGRSIGNRGQSRPRGILGSLSRGGPEFGQADPLSVNVNGETLPDVQQRKYGSQSRQTTGSSFMKTGRIYPDSSFKEPSSPRGMAGINQLETPKAEWEFQHQPMMAMADQQMSAPTTSIDTLRVSGRVNTPSGSEGRQSFTMPRASGQSTNIQAANQKQSQFKGERSLGNSISTQSQRSFNRHQPIYNRESVVRKITLNNTPGMPVDHTALSDPQVDQAQTVFNQLLDSQNPITPARRRWDSPTLFRQLNQINRIQSFTDPEASSVLYDNSATEKAASNSTVSALKVFPQLFSASEPKSQQPVMSFLFDQSANPQNSTNKNNYTAETRQSNLNLTSEFFRNTAESASLFSPVLLGTARHYLVPTIGINGYLLPGFLNAFKPIPDSPIKTVSNNSLWHNISSNYAHDHEQPQFNSDNEPKYYRQGRTENRPQSRLQEGIVFADDRTSTGRISFKGNKVVLRRNNDADSAILRQTPSAAVLSSFVQLPLTNTQRLPDEAGRGHHLF